MEMNKRMKIFKQNIFELNQCHLSGTTQIISFSCCPHELNEDVWFDIFNLCPEYTQGDNGIWTLEVFLRSPNTHENNKTYNFVFKNYENIQLSPNYEMEINSSRIIFNTKPDDEDIEKFPKWAKRWLSAEDTVNGNLTFYFWRQQDRKEEEKSLELTDCIIHAEQKIDKKSTEIYNINPVKDSYRANISVLAKSSQIIYNMIKDTELKYSPQNPLDLSKFFEGFSCRHVHMYLCCVYNPNFQFFKMFDIFEILKLSVKLDNQGLIQRILSMESLASIVNNQVVWNDKENPCKIDVVLDFAKKHNLHQLIIYCELKYLNMYANDQNGPLKNYMKEFKRL